MSRQSIALFVLMSVIWGIPFLLIRVAVEEVAPSVVVFGRATVGAAVLLPIVLLRGDAPGVLRHWRWVAAFAVFQMVIPWLMVASAERHLPSSTAALLVAGVPLVGAAITFARPGREAPLGPMGVAGLLVGLAGVLAVVGVDSGPTELTALVEMAVVVVCCALSPLILARRLAGVPAIGVVGVGLAMCSLVYVPIAATAWPAETPSLEVVASIVLLGVLGTAIGFVAYAALIRAIGPVRATVVTYVNPAVAALLGVVILGETLSLGFLIGFALIILGSAMAVRPRGSSRTDPVSPAAAAPPAPPRGASPDVRTATRSGSGS